MNTISEVNLLTLCNMIRLVHSAESEHVKAYARKQGKSSLLRWVYSLI